VAPAGRRRIKRRDKDDVCVISVEFRGEPFASRRHEAAAVWANSQGRWSGTLADSIAGISSSRDTPWTTQHKLSWLKSF